MNSRTLLRKQQSAWPSEDPAEELRRRGDMMVGLHVKFRVEKGRNPNREEIRWLALSLDIDGYDTFRDTEDVILQRDEKKRLVTPDGKLFSDIVKDPVAHSFYPAEMYELTRKPRKNEVGAIIVKKQKYGLPLATKRFIAPD